jgi:hypothetical protein
MTDKDVERVAEAIFDAANADCGGTPFKWGTISEKEREFTRQLARTAIAAYESAVVETAKLGTVSLTSFDGHCVRIDFPNREDAERMYAALTSRGE